MKSINFLMKQNRYCKFLALPLLLLTLCANYAKGTDVTWTQVAWGDITTSDVFIITITNSGTTYLMTSANGTSSTPGLGNTGTLSASDTKCTFSENDNVKWKKDASSRLCMATNTSKWIYTDTKNNALRVGTSTSGNIWSLDGDYIKSNADRYLSIYSTTDFRSYTSKQPGQVTRFYKASTCSNKVSLTKGVPSNGSFSLNKSNGSYDNCDNNFEVVVSSITPNSGYVFDEITVSGAAGKHSITGPDGSGNYTVSYTKGNSITSTINVTFKQACATPTFSPAAGTYNNNQSVTISTATGGATIYYTTNGSTPTTSSSVYSSAITVSSDNTTIKAIAVKAGLDNSSVGSATYRLTCATPTFSPTAGTYTEAQTVTISCATTSATIYYTTNGSDPTTGSSVYSTSLTVSSTQTIKAIATASGYSNSAIASATYTIKSGKIFQLVTDASDLAAGDELVILGISSTPAYFLMSTTQNGNNRGKTDENGDWEFIDDDIFVEEKVGSAVQVINLEGSAGSWYFNVGTDSYLYAASSSNNYLRSTSKASAGDNGKWAITIGSNPYNATVTAQGTNTHNLLQYNQSNSIFSCYGSSQQAIRIYHHANTSPNVDVGTPTGTSFSYTYGSGPSSAQTFTISGSNLTGNVVINAPSNYEIKAGSGSWGSSVTLTPSTGTIASTTISVRLTAGLSATAGGVTPASYNGNITFTNNDDLTISPIALTGTVSKATLNPSFGSATYTITRDVSTSTSFTLTGVPNDYTGAITYSKTNSPTASARLAVNGTLMTFTAANYSGRWTVTAQFAADANYNAKNSGVTCTVNAVTRDTYIDNVNSQSVSEEQRTDNGVDTYTSPSLSDVAVGDACKGKKVHLIGWASQAFVTNVGNGTLTGADSDYTAGNGFYAVGATLPAASGTTYYAVWGEEEE